MTIAECRRRKRIFKEMLSHWQSTSKFDSNDLNDEQMECLRLALIRSVGIEDLNIAKLKETKPAVCLVKVLAYEVGKRMTCYECRYKDTDCNI